LSFWTTHVPKAEDILLAIDIQQKYNISFWDALIICSAVMLKCDVIWSEDLNNRQFYKGIIVLNPYESSEC
jgi:predicted nucleic acid-binding protein